MLARKALLHVQHLSVDLYRRFPFQIANRHSDTQLRRYAQHHVRMVQQHMAFHRRNGIAFSSLTGRAGGLLN
jgi:hypothetical protein